MANLQELIDLKDYKGIVDLQVEMTSRDVILAKVVSLINLEEYQKALDLIENAQVQEFDFEQAYCLYRLNKLKESFALLQNSTELYRKNKNLYHHMLELKAQVVRVLRLTIVLSTRRI
jgi:Putative TPR-like repeat